MKKTITLIFILAGLNSAFAQLSSDSIKILIKEAVNSKRSKSIIVGIIDANGRRIFSEGIISDDEPRKPDENTIYEIGSITKVFTALALADMSLKHQVNLNDPLSKFLPKNVKSPMRNGKEISLLNLSTHRGTFPRFPYNTDPKDWDKPYVDYSEKQLFEYVSNYKPDIDIDSKWRYSNVGYGILGSILTSVAEKKNYETLIIQEICKPLHMNSTVITLTPKLKKNIATGHAENGQPVNLIDLSAIEAGGALRSNVDDMLTFAAANLGFIKSDLLPAMELTHQKQAKKENHFTYSTMGWTLWEDDGRNILFKDGGTPGFRTFIGIDKKNKFGVVVLSGSNNGITDIGAHIMDSAYKLELYDYSWKLLDTLRASVKKDGVTETIQLYKKLKTLKDPELIFNEYQLNYLGHELRRMNRTDDALTIFELNRSEYPGNVLVYESLGEMYKRNSDQQKAIEYFKKAQKLEPENLHWKFILDKLKNR